MPTPIQPDVNKQNTYNATSTTIPFEKELIYTDAEKQYHLSVLTLIRNARAERERSRIEFNDMGFSEQDDYNIKADLAYVPKAKNKDDIRLVSGLTREKTNTSVAVALSYDFDTEVMAFDKDDEMLAELSDTASDLIEKVIRWSIGVRTEGQPIVVKFLGEHISQWKYKNSLQKITSHRYP